MLRSVCDTLLHYLPYLHVVAALWARLIFVIIPLVAYTDISLIINRESFPRSQFFFTSPSWHHH